jgi:hypothetical protein
MTKKKVKSVQAPDLNKVYENVLIIPDLHFPWCHPDALAFLESLKKDIQPDLVINLGDILDKAALSYHEKDPSMPGAVDEYLRATDHLTEYFDLFPTGHITLGNHDILALRKAKTAGIPDLYMKPMSEILQLPQGWDVHNSFTLQTPRGEVLFQHTLGGDLLRNAQRLSISAVVGHAHTSYGIQYWSTKERLMFAMASGCLIDPKHIAFSYASRNILRPLLGASAIIDGTPILIPMYLDKNGRWEG